MKSTLLLPCGRPKAPFSGATHHAQIAKWQNDLKSYLTRQGLKYTNQRWQIAEIILSTGGHLDAQALVEKVKEKHPAIGSATVYRSIKVLCEASILKESLRDAEGKVFYELFDTHHHDHLVCMDCGEIFEFHDEKIEERQNSVARKMSFSPESHRHVVYARCQLRGQRQTR